jgi:indolepyruvate ferredoxin oxidoreductase alpha subunit
VIEVLAKVAGEFGLYAEWSINEKVATEAAAAASFAGLRSISVMKPDGMNVALDFLTSVSLSGCKGGMVILLGDDPAAHSSIKEEDSRYLARVSHLPVMEPASPQEAKEMVKTAFQLSEELRLPIIVRNVTRVCHASGNVNLGDLPGPGPVARIGRTDKFLTTPQAHPELERKLARAAAWAEKSPYNHYEGPLEAEVVVVTAGPGYFYTKEALEMLGLSDRIGLLKLGMTWPLPEGLILKHLKNAAKVVFCEEVEPFIEELVTSLMAYRRDSLPVQEIFGKKNGRVAGPKGPGIGEMDVDIMLQVLSRVAGIVYQTRPDEYHRLAAEDLPAALPERDRAFCAGCPHRASLWAIKTALHLDGREGLVLGDIGCYAIGRGKTGHFLLHTLHSMGSGAGLACGFGKLGQFMYSQPTISVVGDSTFYHAVVPALINARRNRADFLSIVLDNETTAMTGHQPHPGSGIDVFGHPAPRLSIEEVVQGVGLPVYVQDPFEVESTTSLVYRLLQEPGAKVLILRRACALVATKERLQPRVYVDQERCLAESCGCACFCNRVYSCPANIWDKAAGKARIDAAICNGCGVCASLCPRQAIMVEREV